MDKILDRGCGWHYEEHSQSIEWQQTECSAEDTRERNRFRKLDLRKEECRRRRRSRELF